MDPAFSKPLNKLPGISSYRYGRLKRLELYTLGDLLRFFPRTYENWADQTTIASLPPRGEVAVIATVLTVPNLFRRGKFSTLRATLGDETGRLSAVWFNQPYLQNQLQRGERYLFYGRIGEYRGQPNFQNPRFRKLDEEGAAEGEEGMLPIYPGTQGLTQNLLRKLTREALDTLGPGIPEALPRTLRQEEKLASVRYAYETIHYPKSTDELAIARERLAFEELFLTRLGLRLLRREREDARRPDFAQTLDPAGEAAFQAAVAALPFKLTGAQARALAAVREDLGRARPMNRLIQGDVGSGKTAVAALAMLHTILAGHQAVMMAPTSVLAQQHWNSLKSLLPTLRPEEIGLLTGQTKAKERREILARLSSGELKLLVGTHALLEEGVQFRSLGLAVTDEQHRFGVNQRIRLAQDSDERGEDDANGGAAISAGVPQKDGRGPASASEPAVGLGDDVTKPHVLVMSATPIPRSLALVLYGDLDISVIDELPKGRQPIETYTARSRDRDRVLNLIRLQIERGGQVYVVCPLVEEQDEEEAEQTPLPLHSAEQTWETLRELFPEFEVGLLHGRLKAREKDAVMERFHEGDIQILVSTTVIEVGVDEPRANLMLILNAERFGLAQLHQLRGRIGRGSLKSYCVLISDTDDSLARERLTALCKYRDGFKIAEIDLQLRGPGDFFGTRQHGVPAFKIANLYEDQVLLERASRAADRLVEGTYVLDRTEKRQLEEALQLHFGSLAFDPGL